MPPKVKLSTFETWKKTNKYLNLDSTDTILTCSICVKWKTKLSGTNAFITGSKNLKSSAVNEHAHSKLHGQAIIFEEQERAKAEGRNVHVVVNPPTENAQFIQAMCRISEEEKLAITKLLNIAYFLAYKGRPYSDFADLIELEKMHGVTFLNSNAYQNDMGCKLFVHYAAKSLFEKNLKDKIKRSNFVTVLVNGATDAAIIEKEVVYLLFVDPDDFKPNLVFLSLQSVESQDAQGIKSAIIAAFESCGIEEKLQSMVFFESDGTAVNSGLRAGVITLLQRSYGAHIKFLWCLSHRVELAMKDALGDDMSEVETALRDLYYIYHNSGKRLRELRVLHDILKDVYSFETGEVRPSKSTGTRWIDHKLRAMKAFIDKRGLYLAHIQNVIADTSKRNDKATLEGKRRRLAQASVLLKCAMYVDILEPARHLSLITQKTHSINIVEQVEAVDRTITKYKVMVRKLEKEKAPATSTLPTVKHVLSVIEEEGLTEDREETQYQGIPVTNLQRSKANINAMVRRIAESILSCLTQRYGSLTDAAEEESSKETKEADEIAHAASKILNTRVWMTEKDAPESDSEGRLRIQLEAVSKVYQTFKAVKPLDETNKETLKEQYIMVAEWAATYFQLPIIDQLELWPKLKQIKEAEATELWHLIELCLCCPYGNSICESFISFLHVVKTDWRNRLGESNLTDLLRIKVSGPTLSVFSESYSGKALELWQTEKHRRPNQRKRKQYTARSTGRKRARETDRNAFLVEWLADIGDSDTDTSSDADDGNDE